MQQHVSFHAAPQPQNADPRRSKQVFPYLSLRARDGVEEPYVYDYMGLMSLLFASVAVVTKIRICVWLSVFALASASVNVRRSSLDSRTLMGAGMVLTFSVYTVYTQNLVSL
ncbi:protein asterix-like [Nannochloropsis oceanica]